MDRRTIWAILLMMVIAIAPAIFLKKPVAPGARGGAAGPRGSKADTTISSNPARLNTPASAARVDSVPAGDSARAAAAPPTSPASGEIVRVVSPLYTYGISTRGARLVEATLSGYRSMEPGDQGRP